VRPRRLRIESLECRQLLEAGGLSWPDPRHLTVSFAPDGTRVGVYRSDLFDMLGAEAQSIGWQTEALRAFQTWAAAANVDFGRVADSGQDFGAVGLAQGDPRFGDIRIAAFAQQRALANAVAYEPVAGSWSGDIFLNSNADFGVADRIDLYSVLLNEIGNVLGLTDNDDPDSVMYTDYRGRRNGLTARDIDAIFQLYGPRRPDEWEGTAGNDLEETAAPISPTGQLAQTGQASLDAELSVVADTDYYRVSFTEPAPRVVIRLRAAGRSLLVPRLVVRDEHGDIITQAVASDPLHNDIEVNLARPRIGAAYTVQVVGADDDVFAVGQYMLEVFTRAPYGSPAPSDVLMTLDDRFAAIGFVDQEAGSNESFDTASTLMAPLGYPAKSRYEAVGAIRTTTDVDVYRLVAGGSTMLVYLDTLGTRPIDLQLKLHTSDGELVLAHTITDADGSRPIEMSALLAGTDYYLSLTSDGIGSDDLGNYVLIADFIVSNARLTHIASGDITPAEPEQTRQFVVPRTQLFRFDLHAAPLAEPADMAAVLTILDDKDRVTVEVFAAIDSTTTRYMWLGEGIYSFRFTGHAQEVAASISYELFAAALSDDTGPGLIDPTEAPIPGDADGNGTVERGDVRAFASRFTTFSDSLFSTADFDHDGDVDLDDLATIMLNLGRSTLPTSTGSAPGAASSSAESAEFVDRRLQSDNSLVLVKARAVRTKVVRTAERGASCDSVFCESTSTNHEFRQARRQPKRSRLGGLVAATGIISAPLT
jgi:hypothetical protein